MGGRHLLEVYPGIGDVRFGQCDTCIVNHPETEGGQHRTVFDRIGLIASVLTG